MTGASLIQRRYDSVEHPLIDIPFSRRNVSLHQEHLPLSTQFERNRETFEKTCVRQK